VRPGISHPARQFFVGRPAELALLLEALDAALAGRGSLTVVSGEAGIGKSALIAKHLEHAERLGVPVVTGRCFETEAAPPYGPWLQLLQRLARVGLGPKRAPLKRWLAGARGEPGLDRSQLFDLIASHLVESARDAGLVLVLEDLQWADISSLVLLRQLVDDLTHACLHLVCSYRDNMGADSTRSSILRDLPRLHGARWLVLPPLQDAEVRSFASHLDARGQADILKRAGGNPLYMTELARVLEAGSDLQSIPPGIRDLVKGRLSQMPGPVRDLLATAAVIGSEFDLNMLARAYGKSTDQLSKLLDAAAGAGIVAEAPERRAGFRFSQELFREVLYQDLPPSVRDETHRQVAMAIEDLFAPELDSHLAELSYHWIRASAAAGSDRAKEWTIRAAEHAVKMLAYEEGVRLYRGALHLPHLGDRANVLLQLARTQYLAGEIKPAYESCGEIAQIARSTNEPELLAEAALVLQGIGDFDLAPELTAMCEEALASLSPDDTPLRARVLGQLASQLAYVPDYERTLEVSAAALDVAGRTADTDALVFALRSRQLALSGPQWVRERLALAARMVEIGSSTRQSSAAFWGRLWRIDALLQLGDLTGVDSEQVELERLVNHLQQPIARWHLMRLEAARAAFRGDFAAALALGKEAWELGRRGGHQAALYPWMAFQVLVALETGELSTVQVLVARWPRALRFPVLKLGMARNLLALGHEAQARALFDAGVAQFMTHPMDYQWLPSAVVLSDLACRFEAPDAAELVYPRLLPFSAHLSVPGAGPPIAIDGSVALRLGILARLLGREEAPRHFEDAITVHDRIGARPYSARSRLEYARYMAATGRRREAHRLAKSALLTARELGMRPLAGQAESLAEATSDKPEPERLSRREAEIAAQVAKGLTNKQIATGLFLSERTVEAHVQNILGKLGFRNRSQVAAWAAQRPRED
jgi:DNA-binding CsgD family transcriptional regulator